MQDNLCPYTLYSLQFYALFPLVKLGYLLNLPSVLVYTLALVSPAILLDHGLAVVQSRLPNCSINLVRHSPPPPSHKHSSAIAIGVIVTSSILGLLATIGISLIVDGHQGHFQPLGLYLILLSFFHFSEYFTTSLTNPSTLTLSSFLLDQSVAYILATTASFTEFLIEAYHSPDSKSLSLLSIFGLCLVLGGDLMRKTAMFTAGKSFTHTIASEKQPDHRLVTNGIYALVRHPSYAGWFYWAIGTQILLKNPICALLFAVISHNFFKERIEYEEQLLLQFFGKDYDNYRKKVKLWMPIL